MYLEVMAIVIRHYLEIICTPMSEMEGMRYSEKVKQRKEAIDFFESDEFIETGLDLDDLIEKTLKDKYPPYYDLLIYKIDGL